MGSFFERYYDGIERNLLKLKTLLMSLVRNLLEFKEKIDRNKN